MSRRRRPGPAVRGNGRSTGGDVAGDHLLDDIHELNLAYLLLMQRLINTDRDVAMFRLRIDDDMAELLSRMPISKLAPLARCDQLLCHFSITDADQLDAMLKASSGEDLREIHAAILLGGKERRAANDRRREARRSAIERRREDRGPADGIERRLGGERRAGADRREQTRRENDRDAEAPRDADQGDPRRGHGNG